MVGSGKVLRDGRCGLISNPYSWSIDGLHPPLVLVWPHPPLFPHSLGRLIPTSTNVNLIIFKDYCWPWHNRDPFLNYPCNHSAHCCHQDPNLAVVPNSPPAFRSIPIFPHGIHFRATSYSVSRRRRPHSYLSHCFSTRDHNLPGWAVSLDLYRRIDPTLLPNTLGGVTAMTGFAFGLA